jgi:hypothetical protein
VLARQQAPLRGRRELHLRGNVDLRGTTFSIDPSVSFVPDGYLPYGTSTFSPDRKTVDFTGGGYCGENGPTPVLLLVQD